MQNNFIYKADNPHIWDHYDYYSTSYPHCFPELYFFYRLWIKNDYMPDIKPYLRDS